MASSRRARRPLGEHADAHDRGRHRDRSAFHYRDTLAGSHVLTASAAGATSGTQTVTVSPGPVAALTVCPPPRSFACGQRCGSPPPEATPSAMPSRCRRMVAHAAYARHGGAQNGECDDAHRESHPRSRLRGRLGRDGDPRDLGVGRGARGRRPPQDRVHPLPRASGSVLVTVRAVDVASRPISAARVFITVNGTAAASVPRVRPRAPTGGPSTGCPPAAPAASPPRFAGSPRPASPGTGARPGTATACAGPARPRQSASPVTASGTSRTRASGCRSPRWPAPPTLYAVRGSRKPSGTRCSSPSRKVHAQPELPDHVRVRLDVLLDDELVGDDRHRSPVIVFVTGASWPLPRSPARSRLPPARRAPGPPGYRA